MRLSILSYLRYFVDNPNVPVKCSRKFKSHPRVDSEGGNFMAIKM